MSNGYNQYPFPYSQCSTSSQMNLSDQNLTVQQLGYFPQQMQTGPHPASQIQQNFAPSQLNQPMQLYQPQYQYSVQSTLPQYQPPSTSKANDEEWQIVPNKKRGRTSPEQNPKLKQTKIDNYWLNTPTANKFNVLINEETHEADTEEEKQKQEEKPPPIFIAGVMNNQMRLEISRSPNSDYDKNGTEDKCQKPLARVTPIKKCDTTDTCVTTQNSTVRNLNSSLNYPSTYHYSIRNRTNKNNRDLVPEEEDGTDYSPDPFEDSGSAYSPSSDGSNSSLDVSKENVTSPITEDHNKEDTPLTQRIVAQNTKDDVELCPVSVAETRKERENNGKRIRDKGHSCYFCQKIICNNFSRHVEKHHENETEAARILAMPKNSKIRRDAFANLIRYGDFYHNCDVLSLKEGELILTRRPTTKEKAFISYSDYGPCPECLGFLLKRQLWHHLRYTCPSKSKNDEDSERASGKGPIVESAALLNGILGHNFTPRFLDIVNHFRNDAISSRCKEDNTIMLYGAFLYEKYSCTQSELIRQSMRQLGRLTLEMKRKGESFQNLSEVLVPQKFDLIVNATKEICIVTSDPTKRQEYQIPSLALKIGYAIKKCASIERGQCLRRGDLKKNRQLVAFLHLLDLEWSVRISSNALSTLYSRKQNAEDLLPITSDLIKLNSFLDSKIREIRKDLSSLNYSKLVSLTLARIIIFNKRRSGEAAKMTLSQYSSRPNWKNFGTEELKNSLTPLENKIASSLTMVKIMGKRGRIVPILLTSEIKETIDLIISQRIQYGVLSENPYVFAISKTTGSHMRGHDCLKKWCEEADLNAPDLVTSTKLRKYVATVCQIFNLNENEYDWLARHLGHDVRVHREFYRLQENAVELTKVSRLLLAVDQGEAHKFAGKALKDINLTGIHMDGIEDKEADCIEANNSNVGEDEQNENIALPEITDGGAGAVHRNDPKKKCVSFKRRPWTTEEKEIILKEFKSLIKRGSLPGKEQCTKLLEEQIVFTGRKWTDVKFFVKNYLQKLRKITNTFSD
ncbi:unnamed protein product [Diabrotica balteata]|uniref:Uncharacterized protein n=1 Tax=Diabrotica balteata TaxID=107213 RepID=A0A9N9T1I6_DIABA|nr:unnamed protein product [Diabrotica balteata]